MLSNNELIEVEATEIRATAVGLAVARLGISVESAGQIISFLGQFGNKFGDEDLLFELCFCEEVSNSPPYLRREERASARKLRNGTQWVRSPPGKGWLPAGSESCVMSGDRQSEA